jgi:hypothetical protein
MTDTTKLTDSVFVMLLAIAGVVIEFSYLLLMPNQTGISLLAYLCQNSYLTEMLV